MLFFSIFSCLCPPTMSVLRVNFVYDGTLNHTYTYIHSRSVCKLDTRELNTYTDSQCRRTHKHNENVMCLIAVNAANRIKISSLFGTEATILAAHCRRRRTPYTTQYDTMQKCVCVCARTKMNAFNGAITKSK